MRLRVAFFLAVACLSALAVAAWGQYPTAHYRTYQYQTYGGYGYYTPYTPPKVTYLLIVPAPEPKKAEPKAADPAPKAFDPPAKEAEPAPKKFDPPAKLLKSDEPAPAPAPAPKAVEDATPPELAAALTGVLTRHCGNCHGPTSAKGGLTLVTQEEGAWKVAPLSRNQWWEVYGRANAGQMPPAAAKDATKAVPEADLVPLLKRALVK